MQGGRAAAEAAAALRHPPIAPAGAPFVLLVDHQPLVGARLADRRRGLGMKALEGIERSSTPHCSRASLLRRDGFQTLALHLCERHWRVSASEMPVAVPRTPKQRQAETVNCAVSRRGGVSERRTLPIQIHSAAPPACWWLLRQSGALLQLHITVM